MGSFSNSVKKFFHPDPNQIGQWGYTRLQYAVSVGDLGKVRSLIADGADMNLPGTYKYPPLHMALRDGNYPIVLALIKAGANVNLQDSFGQTPLHIATTQNQETFLLALLKFNADPNIKDSAGRTPAHVARTYAVDVIEALARHNARFNEQDEKGDTPLHYFLDHPEMVGLLLTHGANPNIANKKGQTAYMMMLDEKRLQRYPKELQKALILKADIDSANPLGETILHLAARLEMEETFLSAVAKAELSVKDAKGNNVLHALAHTQNARMISRLLERAPELVADANKAGVTPMEELLRHIVQLSDANKNRWLDAARVMLGNKADPDSKDDKGRGLVHHAVMQDKIDFLDEALVSGASPNLKDQDGKTALQYAIERKNLRAMDVLLDRGADPDLIDRRGWTALDRLAESGDRESPIVQRLIVAGGQYQKQLPLYPELMRRPKVLDKGKPAPGKPITGPSGPRL